MPLFGGNIIVPNKIDVPIVLYAGDSITAQGTRTAFPTLPSTAFQSGYSSTGYDIWERFLLGGVYTASKVAVGGTAISTIVSSILALDLSPFSVISMQGGTHNHGNGTYATALTDLALIESVCIRALNENKAVRLLTLIPRDATQDSDSDNYIYGLNSGIRALGKKYPNVFVADVFREIQDVTSDTAKAAAGMLSDGVHPNSFGAYTMAKNACAQSMSNALRYAGYGYRLDQKTRKPNTSFTELLSNTNFRTQTGGGGNLGATLTVGAVPGSWNIYKQGTPTDVKIYYPFYVADALRQRGMWVTSKDYAAGDTVTESSKAYICLVAHTSGTFATDLAATKWERVYSSEYSMQIEITAGGSGDGVRISQNITSLPSDVVQGLAEIKTESGSSLMSVPTIYTEQWSSASPGPSIGHYNYSFYYGGTLALDFTDPLVQITSKQAPFSAYTGTISPNLFVIVLVLTGAGTASVIISNPSVRKYA